MSAAKAPCEDLLARLNDKQRSVLGAWMPGVAAVHDHSWDFGTTVLQVAHDGRQYIIKAGDGGLMSHHLVREFDAHTTMLAPLVNIGRAPRLIRSGLEAQLLVTEYLPGQLVLSHPAVLEPDTYRQAGRLLARLHRQPSVVSAEYEATENARSLEWLAGSHRIDPQVVADLEEQIKAWPTPPAVLVPTHGDYHSRNWIVRDGVVSVIDFGRAALRPAMTDFCPFDVHGVFAKHPELEGAFVEGYGCDSRQESPESWRRERIRKGIATAAWACKVGDHEFEAQGMRILAEAMNTTV